MPAVDATLPVAAIEHEEIRRTVTHLASDSYSTPANLLLSALPQADYKRLLPHLQPTLLHAGQVLHTCNTPSCGVHFIDDGVVSAVLSSGDGHEMETITIGREGMVGRAASILGDTPTFRHATVHVGGRAWWLPVEALKREFERRGALHDLLVGYTDALLTEAGQIAMCKRWHKIEARLSHWLLLLRERAQTDELPFTQDFIAELIEARPAEVTVASGLLWKEGLIRFNNNRVTILNPQGLQAKACECAAVIQQEYEQLRLAATKPYAA